MNRQPSEKVLAIIPARMRSSRFPGKPLARILDRTMIEHVYVRTKMAARLQGTYIATCDREIHEQATSFGAPVILTSDRHDRCTDRVAEAARSLECDIVVLVQGDEPLIHPSMIDEVLAPLLGDPDLPCCTLMSRIAISTTDGSEWKNPHVIKVVFSKDYEALYMSRAPIPSRERETVGPLAKHLGIIAFRKNCLMKYAQLAPTPLEEAESIDMLRLLENRIRVRMVFTSYDSMSVDIPEQLRSVATRMTTDPIYQVYKRSESAIL